jgi:hypothetical protein
MRHTIFLIATCVLVVGCSSGGSGSSTAEPGSRTSGGAQPSGAGSVAGAGGGLPAGRRASGAKVRIVNAYAPLNGDPGPIDVYAAPWAAAGDTPLVSVPYGTASAFFDPTVSDEAGDMSLSFYWAGTTGNGSELASQSETLKGGEIMTFILTTSSSTQDAGRRFGEIQPFFEHASGDSLSQATPAPGKALLVVDSLGLDQVLPATANSTWYFSTGNGCTKTIGDDANSLTAAGPGGTGTYQLDPGSYTGSIYAYPSDATAFPTCNTNALIGNLAIQAVAGRTVILLIYGPKVGDLRTLFIPLDT